MVAGFPNLFMVTGPGSPSVLTNMISAIEQHVDWIADCLAALRARGVASMEATVAAEEAWVAHVNEVAHHMGVDRVIFGSDWPVSLIRSSHAGWTRMCEDLTKSMGADEKAAFWGGNAARVYRIKC